MRQGTGLCDNMMVQAGPGAGTHTRSNSPTSGAPGTFSGLEEEATEWDLEVGVGVDRQREEHFILWE